MRPRDFLCLRSARRMGEQDVRSHVYYVFSPLQHLLYIQIRFQICILLGQYSRIFPSWNHWDLCCATTSTSTCSSSSLIRSGSDAAVRLLIGLRNCCNARLVQGSVAQHDAPSTKSKIHDTHSGPAWCPSVAGESNLTNSCFNVF